MLCVLFFAYFFSASPTQSSFALSPVPQWVSGTSPRDAASGAAVVFAGRHAPVLMFGLQTRMRPRFRSAKICTIYETLIS